jgi:hypothetical protein
MTEKKKPVEFIDFPMPSADENQKFYRRRFRLRVSSRLAPAVVQSKGADGGDLQLLCYLTVKLYERDLVSSDSIKKMVDEQLTGLQPDIIKLLNGVYTTPKGEELPMVDKHGQSVRMPLLNINPNDRDGGTFIRNEDFSMASLARFLQSPRFWTPDVWTHREPAPFRQAVGAQVTKSSHEDKGEHSSKLQFTGTAFGRFPFQPKVVEFDGVRKALFPEHSLALGFTAFMPASLINELLRVFLRTEPFFQNVINHYIGFTMPDESPKVRALLAAPREERKPEAKAEGGKRKHDRKSETLDEKVARLTSELAEFEQKAEAAKGTPDEAKANQKLGGARGRLTQAKALLETKAEESSEAPASPAPEA